jgi:hypothetical protein
MLPIWETFSRFKDLLNTNVVISCRGMIEMVMKILQTEK